MCETISIHQTFIRSLETKHNHIRKTGEYTLPLPPKFNDLYLTLCYYINCQINNLVTNPKVNILVSVIELHNFTNLLVSASLSVFGSFG